MYTVCKVVHHTMWIRPYVMDAHSWTSTQLFTVLLRVEAVTFDPLLLEVDGAPEKALKYTIRIIRDCSVLRCVT